jgi:putative protease
VGVRSIVEPGLSLPVAALNEMRRDLLAELMEHRKMLPLRKEGEFLPGFRLLNREDKPVVTVSVMPSACPG